MNFFRWLLNLFKRKDSVKEIPSVIRVEIEDPSEVPPPIPEDAKKDPYIKLGCHGIDLSHHNEKVELIKLKSQGFVILKATEGKAFVDSKFDSRWLGLSLMGIKKGAYHFYRTNLDWKVQADHFLKTLGRLDGNEILALDYETCKVKGLIQTTEDLQKNKQNALKFLRYVKEQTGITPWFYTYHSVIVDCGFEEEFAEYPLWYARYTKIYPKPNQGPWKQWEAWQYSDKGVVEGVSNNVDLNWFRK